MTRIQVALQGGGLKSLSVPVPPGSRSRSDLRRSMRKITLAWVFGAVWFTTTTGTTLTIFASALGATPFDFGVLTALPFIATLAALPGSLLIERTGKRKPIFLLNLYAQRLLWIPTALLPVWMLSRYGPASIRGALSLFLILYFLIQLAGSAGSPAWISWMADIVPSRLNGKYFSRRRQWGMLTAIPAALFAGWFLDHQMQGASAGTVLRWCAVLFVASAVFGLADIFHFQFVPEPAKTPRRDGLLKAFRDPLADRQFLRFAGWVGLLTFSVSLMGQFSTLYLLKVVKVDNLATQLILVVAPMAAQLLVLPIWGAAADRVGKKPLLVLATLGLIPTGFGWCFLTSGNPWLGYVLSALGGALWTGIDVANMNRVLESANSQTNDAGSAYVAVNSVIINIAGCLGGLVAGAVAQWLQAWHWQLIAGGKSLSFYDVLFAGSGVLRIAGVALIILTLHEPAARSTREALRFILATMREAFLSKAAPALRLFTARKPEPILRIHPDPAPTPVRRAA